MTKQYDDSSQLVMCHEFLLINILSRLPVKPLVRFKCVSKQWQSIIHKDRSFIDLHFTRSKTSNFSVGDGGGGISLFIRWHRHKVFSSAKLVLSEGGVTAVQREVPKPRSYLTHVFGAINGLLSLVNRSTYSVCILNPSTGQSTPWIQPMFKQQHCRIEYANANWYYFGYDPATMEHKVVLFWIKGIYSSRGFFLRYQNVCEVMTVDGRQHNNNNLSWRRIDDELLPPAISPTKITSSVYVDGSIYWLHTGPRYSAATEPLIGEFNVGSEKFRVISFPDYIIKEICYPYDCKLIQIDGCLAVLAKKMMYLSGNPSMKFKDNTLISTSSSNGGDFYWTEETFIMLHSEWSRLQFDSVQAVPGTNLLIIQSEEEARSTFYFYDWRKKSFKKESFSVAKRKRTSFDYLVYEESLLPVM